MRKIKLEDKKIIKLLNEKAEISKKQTAITDQMTKLEQEFNKNISNYARFDEKARPMILKIVEGMELGEFEQLSRVHQEKNNWFIEIADRLEELRQAIKEDKEKASKQAEVNKEEK